METKFITKVFLKIEKSPIRRVIIITKFGLYLWIEASNKFGKHQSVGHSFYQDRKVNSRHISFFLLLLSLNFLFETFRKFFSSQFFLYRDTFHKILRASTFSIIFCLEKSYTFFQGTFFLHVSEDSR